MLVDGEEACSSYKVRDGQRMEARLPEEGLAPEEIPVPVVFEDEYVLVVDKPAGLVVHPGAGNPSGTLVNALLSKGICGWGGPDRPGRRPPSRPRHLGPDGRRQGRAGVLEAR